MMGNSLPARTVAAAIAMTALIPLTSCSATAPMNPEDAKTPAPVASNSPLTSPTSGNSSVTSCSIDDPSWTTLAEKVSPSVVSVEVSSGGHPVGEGSGVAVDEHHIVTNAHVVGDATDSDVSVTLSDNSVQPVTIAGRDPITDLAVLTVQDTKLTPIPIATSAEVRTGQPVMAVGNPLGLAGTVTTGIVSALNRPVAASEQGTGPSVATVTNAIQTSAPINPGNSGGALVNGCGELIGINSSIATLGPGSGSIGIGFAIPSNEVSMVAQQLIRDGRAHHVQLGISVADGIAARGTQQIRSAMVASVVVGGPAHKAGLQVGDHIISIDGVATTSALSSVGHVRGLPVGKSVNLLVVRDGRELTVSATLASD